MEDPTRETRPGGAPDPERRFWLDRPANVNKIVWTLVAACALLLVADLLYEKHVHFGYEKWFGFAAFFGFLAYSAIVAFGKGMRRLVRRDEDYYETPETPENAEKGQ